MSKWSNPVSAYSGLSEFSKKLQTGQTGQTGQISNWSNLKMVKFPNWSNFQTGQTGQISKWSNPVGAYSGLGEFSKNYKLVKLVKLQTGQNFEIVNFSKMVKI